MPRPPFLLLSQEEGKATPQSKPKKTLSILTKTNEAALRPLTLPRGAWGRVSHAHMGARPGPAPLGCPPAKRGVPMVCVTAKSQGCEPLHPDHLPRVTRMSHWTLRGQIRLPAAVGSFHWFLQTGPMLFKAETPSVQ